MKFVRRFLQYVGVAAVVIIWVFVVQKFAPFGAANSGNLKASAWKDQNANGVKDAGEPWLANVCIWYSLDQANNTPPSNCTRTDASGNWNDVFQGESAQAGLTVHYFAVPPDGYRLTTSNVFDLPNPSFGFAPLLAPQSLQLNSLMQSPANDLAEKIQPIVPWIILILALAYGAWQTKDTD